MVDYDRLDRDRIMEVDPIDLLFARATSHEISEVVVAGRTIVRDGVVQGIDLPAVENELRERYRQAVGRFTKLDEAWPALEREIERWFRKNFGCH